jgi:hypothetical protein
VGNALAFSIMSTAMLRLALDALAALVERIVNPSPGVVVELGEQRALRQAGS